MKHRCCRRPLLTVMEDWCSVLELWRHRAVNVWLGIVLASPKTSRCHGQGRICRHVAAASDEVMSTVSETVLIRFQFASTALTMTLEAVPSARAVGGAWSCRQPCPARRSRQVPTVAKSTKGPGSDVRLELATPATVPFVAVIASSPPSSKSSSTSWLTGRW